MSRLPATLSLPVLALLFLLPLDLRAALQFDAFLGLDGYVPEGVWSPIVCEVYNDGTSFNGFIEIKSGLGQSDYSRLVPVELPTGTRKRITIPIFCTSSYGDWDAVLRDSNGRIRDEQRGLRSRGSLPDGTVLVGSIARQAGWTPAFRNPPSFQANLKPVAARFPAPLFPDNPIVLQGMKALYLSSEQASMLRAQQVAALRSWIASGGNLILAVDQVGDVNSLPWLRQLVPMELNGVRQLKPGGALENWLRSPVKGSILNEIVRSSGIRPDRQKEIKVTMDRPYSDTVDDDTFGMADLLVATGQMRDGEALVSAGDAPLVVSKAQALGKVTVLLFSPEREPFKSWKNQPAFWSRISDVPPRIYASAESYYGGGWSIDGVFGAMVDSRQVRKLPIGWLFIMLLAYLAIIGPVDQVWLRKINKPMLTWITFPGYVILFSALIYLVGYKLRAGESEWNELHVVDVFPSGSEAELHGRTFGSIYSPVNQRYTFESKGRASAFRAEYMGRSSGAGSKERGEIMQSESSFRAEVFVPVWTCQLYVNDWLQQTEAPFFATVEKDGNGWKVAIQNKLDKPLTCLRLVIGGSIYDLDDVPARQMKEFPKSAAKNPRALSNFVTQYGSQFQAAVQQRQAAFGGLESGRLNDLPNCAEAASFIAQLGTQGGYYGFLPAPTFDLSGAAEGNNAIVLAWVEGYLPGKSLNQFTPRRKQANTLWRMALPLNSTP